MECSLPTLQEKEKARQYPVGWNPAYAAGGGGSSGGGDVKSKAAKKAKKKEGGDKGSGQADAQKQGGGAGTGVAAVTEALKGMSVEEGGAGAELSKKLRAASKKLRTIDDLKAKVDKGEIVPNDEEKEKLAKRGVLVQEIRQV